MRRRGQSSIWQMQSLSLSSHKIPKLFIFCFWLNTHICVRAAFGFVWNVTSVTRCWIKSSQIFQNVGLKESSQCSISEVFRNSQKSCHSFGLLLVEIKLPRILKNRPIWSHWKCDFCFRWFQLFSVFVLNWSNLL